MASSLFWNINAALVVTDVSGQPIGPIVWGVKRGAYRALVGKREGRRPLGRPRRRWEDNIKMDLREVGWGGAWTGSIWLRIETGGGLL
jgi:hypothetical protein